MFIPGPSATSSQASSETSSLITQIPLAVHGTAGRRVSRQGQRITKNFWRWRMISTELVHPGLSRFQLSFGTENGLVPDLWNSLCWTVMLELKNCYLWFFHLATEELFFSISCGWQDHCHFEKGKTTLGIFKTVVSECIWVPLGPVPTCSKHTFGDYE